MSYERIRATAEATRYIEQREAEDRAAERKRATAHGDRMMACGLTCSEWLEQYRAKKNNPGTPPRINTEATNDDQDRRSAEGTEAASVGAGESLGDAPQERSGCEASGKGSQKGSWVEEAYPSEPDQRDGEPFETPF